VHGWNFIGGKNGNVKDDTDDLTREFIRLNAKFANVGKIGKKQNAEYEEYLKIKEKFGRLKEKNEREFKYYSAIYQNMKHSIDTLKALTKVDKLRADDVKNFETNDPSLLFAKGFLMQLYHNAGEEADLDDYLKELKEGVDQLGVTVNYGYNVDFDSRKIVGAYFDSNSTFHGFSLLNGKFTTIDFPNSTFTWITGINSEGDLVGFYNDQSGNQHGFIQRDGDFITVDVPGATSTAGSGRHRAGCENAGSAWRWRSAGVSRSRPSRSTGSATSTSCPTGITGSRSHWPWGRRRSRRTSPRCRPRSPPTASGSAAI